MNSEASKNYTFLPKLCRSFNEAIDDGKYDSLLLIPMFILDFLSIHPFNDGNGRMSRLLTLLLLYRSGYIVGKYISIEKHTKNFKTVWIICMAKRCQNLRGISLSTIERTLKEMVDNGEIEKVGSGRGTGYVIK